MGSIIHEQLGGDWDKLNPNIQARFSQDPSGAEKILYQGVMHEVRRSRLGAAFAYFAYLIGKPLTPFEASEIPMIVQLSAVDHGVRWERIYKCAGDRTFKVSSVKKSGRQGEMMECVGCGFGMLLRVFVENTALHFKSYRFFWQCGRLRLPIPNLLSPGETEVIHTDLGGGRFEFKMIITNKLFGRTFYQRGTFSRLND